MPENIDIINYINWLRSVNCGIALIGPSKIDKINSYFEVTYLHKDYFWIMFTKYLISKILKPHGRYFYKKHICFGIMKN